MADERDWETFKRQFYAKSGLDLNQYKPQQMQRRITNLARRHGAATYMEFFRLLQADARLYREFVDYLTINVTEFCRTPGKFQELEEKVLPALLQQRRQLNIWSAGCSTGAEPYSVAIILRDITPTVRHRILATDIDATMLARAKEGVYTATELKNLSPVRLARYFHQSDGSYALNDDIKQRVDFQRHDLLRDSYGGDYDLILCRNVVIYFTEEAKEQLYRKFFQALRPGGVLFVGGTECILNYREIGFTAYLPFFYRRPV